MKRFLDRLASMRLAVGLLAYLTVGCVLATLVPQGLEPAAYEAMMPRLLARLVVETGLDHFFGSLAFLLPSMLFLANLSVCSARRLAAQLRKRSGRRHGPDVLHLGLVLLVVGAVWSFSGHRSGSVSLLPGERVNLPDGAALRLDEFRFERYDDGRPRDYVSVVSLEKDGAIIEEGYELRVNHPLRYGDLTFYQVSYREEPGLSLASADGSRRFRLAQGRELEEGGARLFYMAPSPDGSRAVLRVSDAAGERVERPAPGEPVGGLVFTGFGSAYASGLEASSDPGYPLVLASLALVALGTAWTFLQKLKEMPA